MAFELQRREQLSGELRQTLALGPPPPPVQDDLEEFEGMLGEEEEEAATGDRGDPESVEEGVEV